MRFVKLMALAIVVPVVLAFGVMALPTMIFCLEVDPYGRIITVGLSAVALVVLLVVTAVDRRDHPSAPSVPFTTLFDSE